MSPPAETKAHRRLVLRWLLKLRQSRYRRLILTGLVRLHNSAYHWISFFASHQGIHPKHAILNYHQFFLDNIASSDAVLDVGCGNGAVAFDLAQKARQVVGIDFSAGNIATARRNYQRDNLVFIRGDATTHTFDQKFDAIVLSNVLEHIADRPTFLRRLSEVAPTILIRVPLLTRDWISVFKKNEGFEYRLDETHCIEFTEAGFEQEIGLAGLRLQQHYIAFGELYAVCHTAPT